MSENNNIYNFSLGMTLIPTIEMHNLRSENAQLKIRIEDLLSDKQNLQKDIIFTTTTYISFKMSNILY